MKFILFDDDKLYADAKREVSNNQSIVYLDLGFEDDEILIDMVYMHNHESKCPSYIDRNIVSVHRIFELTIGSPGNLATSSIMFFVKFDKIHLLPNDLYELILMNLDRVC